MTKAYAVGDKGDPYIAKIQNALNYKLGAAGPASMPEKVYLVADAGFGPKTATALKAYQKSIGLEQTGIYDAKTAFALDPYIAGKMVAAEDLVSCAANLKVELACVKAVTEVEAKGTGYFDNGKSKILFERHVFRRQLLQLMKASSAVAGVVAKKLGVGVPLTGPDINLLDHTLTLTNPDIYNEETGGYVGGMAEYDRLARAISLNETAALSSASWGMFQIMGYHFSRLGYKSVQDMVTASQASEKNHLKDFTAFVLSDTNLITSLRDKNFLKFALNYNGRGQQGYDVRIKNAYTKYSA